MNELRFRRARAAGYNARSVSVAILIVNYRAYESVERSLSTLAPHLERSDEVVVVDYESEEPERRRIEASCPRAVVIPVPENRGFAAGVNIAARRARSPFLLLLNPDTEMIGPVPQVLRSWLVDHPRTGIVGPRIFDADGTVQPSARRFPNASTLLGGRSTWLTRAFPRNWLSRWNLPARESTGATDVDWVSGACLMTRRELFDALGGLDESFFLYWEDADYCRRAADRGFGCTYLPTAAVVHTGGACAARALPLAIREFHRSAAHLYWKHRLPPGRLFTPLVRAGLALRGRLRLRRALRERDGDDAPERLAMVREPSIQPASESRR